MDDRHPRLKTITMDRTVGISRLIGASKARNVHSFMITIKRAFEASGGHAEKTCDRRALRNLT